MQIKEFSNHENKLMHWNNKNIEKKTKNMSIKQSKIQKTVTGFCVNPSKT